MNTKTYSELIDIPSFEERYQYCKLSAAVADPTFAGHRWLNQVLYSSPEWRKVRRDVIIRDNGNDLAHADRPIVKQIYIHHLNPITIEDIEKRRDCIFDPENLICVSFDTHQAIHYGDEKLLIPTTPTTRTPNDTCPWKTIKDTNSNNS